MNLYMTALSNIHTPPQAPPPPHPNPTAGQTGGRHAQGQRASGGGGWAILIQCLLYLEREEANGAFLTRLTLDQSHHTFSQGTWASLFFYFFLPSPPFFSSRSLRCIHSPFHFYSVKDKKEKEKKNKVDKGCPPSIQQREGGGTESSPEDRPESRDIPQCSW